MKVARTITSARRLAGGRPMVLVPTMGALHEGHAALVRKARKLAGSDGFVAVSIFVNPTQFGPKEDFGAYPRTWDADLALCEKNGADGIFHPSVEEVYADDRSITVEESSLSNVLCGASRPGHFRGVCTVVAKLFNILRPDTAVFGEKDWQQLAVIRRMVRDLNFSVKIVGHPTIREKDGLAMSSRNAYLTPEERAVAPGIQQAMKEAAKLATPSEILHAARTKIARIPGGRIDYVELVDAETLQPAANLRRPARLAAAVFLGKARLIDNIGVPPRKS